MIQNVDAILAEHSLLGQLPEDARAHLRSLVSTRVFQANQVVFLKGDEGNALMAVLSGRIRICSYSADGREVVLNVMRPGDVFGEIAMIDGGPRTADAFAMETTRLLILSRGDFMPFLERHPAVAITLLKVLCERLRRTSNQVEDYFFLDLRCRLAKCLLHLRSETDAGRNSGGAVTIRASQQLLASMIGTSREAVNKQLRAWEAMGLIALHRGSITILGADVLAAVVQETEG
jgi:CRP/FNR family transcriptional regulator, cyclic AMP receptor protein